MLRQVHRVTLEQSFEAAVPVSHWCAGGVGAAGAMRLNATFANTATLFSSLCQLQLWKIDADFLPHFFGVTYGFFF